jgi:glycosyltransferase involved in cell wall biosynthesis
MGKLVFFWDNFGPLHIDRCDAVAARFSGRHEVIGLELANKSNLYSWKPEQSGQFKKVTLIANQGIDEISWMKRFGRVLRACLSAGRGTQYFMCHYQDSAVLAVSVILRLLGRRVFTMGCSKFDDYHRGLRKEVLKSIFYLPYNGGIASGVRSRDYMRFLGIPSEHIKTSYNVVSLKRIRDLADAPPAPEGTAFRERHFSIVARLVAKKNISMALKAMVIYAQQVPQPRMMDIYGDGYLEADLREQARRDGISHLVRFHGFVQTAEISKAFANSLALLLPSLEEQFGNVVPEAQAMGLPVILSDNCGARDVLVRNGVNGFVIESDNPVGMAYFMQILSEDEDRWRNMCLAVRPFADLADSGRFADAVESLVSI